MNAYCRRSVLAAVPFVVNAAPAAAQSFNVDLDVSHYSWVIPTVVGAPSSAFPGAAGQTGFWNAVSTNSTGPVALKNLAGVTTGVTISMTTTSPSGFGHWSFNNTSNTGDFARLLNDSHIMAAASTYTFAGLQPGAYMVYSYGVRPQTGVSNSRFTVSGVNSGPQTVIGPMPGNAFALGVTHAMHATTVPGSGVLTITLDRDPTLLAGGNHGAAYANGFQLVRVPAPGAATIMLSAGAMAIRRRRRA